MKLFLFAAVAATCFCGLARAGGGYGSPVQRAAPPVQIQRQVRQSVDFVDTVEYVPQIRRQAFLRTEIEDVPVCAPLARALSVDPCPPAQSFGFRGYSASFGAAAGFSSVGASSYGSSRLRGRFVEKSSFRGRLR